MFKKTKAWFVELADDLVFLGKKTKQESRQFGRYIIRLVDSTVRGRPFIKKIVPLDAAHTKTICSPYRQPKLMYSYVHTDSHLNLTAPKNYWVYNPFGSPSHPTYNNDHGTGRF